MLVYCVNVFVSPPMLVYCVNVFMNPYVGVLCECVCVPPMLVYCVNVFVNPYVGVLCERVCVPPMLVYSVNVFTSPQVCQHLKPLFTTSTFPPQLPSPFFLYPSFPFSLLHSSFSFLSPPPPLPSNCVCAVCFVVSSKKSSLDFDP